MASVADERTASVTASAGIVGGAVPPLIAAAIIARWGLTAFSLVLIAFCLVGLVCALRLRETRGADLKSRVDRRSVAVRVGLHPTMVEVH